MALFIAAVLYVAKLPSVRALQVCTNNLQELGDAVSRYRDVTGHRPARLRDLEKQYLTSPSLLRCPLDKTPGNEPSYTYNPNARDSQPMLECDRHKLRPDMPKCKLRILGDGTYTQVNPSPREIIREAEKRARSSR